MPKSTEISPGVPGAANGDTDASRGSPAIATVHLRAALRARAGLSADNYPHLRGMDLGESPPQLQAKAVADDWSQWIGSSEFHFRLRAALHSALPVEWQPILFDKDELRVRAALVSRPGFPSHLRAPAVLMLLELLLAEDGDWPWDTVFELRDAIKLIEDSVGLRVILEWTDFAEAQGLEGWSQEAVLYRHAVATNSYCPDDVWLRLLEDDERTGQEDMDDGEEVWHGILESRRPPATGFERRLRERLVEAIHRDLDFHRGRGSGDQLLRPLVAAYPWTPPDLLVELVAIDDSVDAQLALNPALPDQLQVSARDIDTALPGLRRVFAGGFDPKDHWAFAAIAADSDPKVRMACAENVNVPHDVLQHLAADADERVRTAAWSNPSATDSIRAVAAILGVKSESA